MTGALCGTATGGLAAAADCVDLAVRALAAADDVVWVSAAATRYRAVLGEGIAALRAARSLLDEASVAVAAHDAAVVQATAARVEAVARQVLLAGLGAQAPGLGAPDLLAWGSGRGLW